MASQAQIDANRRNAKKSTGPKTEAGKQAASANALKHGLCAQTRMLPHEDPSEFDTVRNRLIADHKPATAIEFTLIDEIAQATLMLERSGRYEAALFEIQIRQLKLSNGRRDRPFSDDDTAIAINLTLPDTHPALNTLFRYIARAESKLYRAIDRLRSLQNDRLRRERQQTPPAKSTESKGQLASFGEQARSASASASATPAAPRLVPEKIFRSAEPHTHAKPNATNPHLIW